jgi:hypothetical protein
MVCNRAFDQFTFLLARLGAWLAVHMPLGNGVTEGTLKSNGNAVLCHCHGLSLMDSNILCP